MRAPTSTSRAMATFVYSRILCVLGAIALIFGKGCEASNVFVRREGTKFVLDGSMFLFNGFNSYWLMHAASEPSERENVAEVLRQAAASGLTVCRTWAFRDGGDDRALQTAPGVYDERAFQGLDFVISEAQKCGVRLILSLVNNYDDFGGRPQYVQWARDAGGSIDSIDDFYTNPVVKGYYKDHVQKVVTRKNTITGAAYKDDATIMAWELINEPRCQADYSGKTVNDWVQEMAAYLKSLDSRHMLEVGMEGFYGDSTPEKEQYNPGYQVGTDYISTNLIEEIDFATIHAYPDLWLPGQDDGAQIAFVQRWMRSHWDDATDVLKKPLVFAEFGRSKNAPGYTENSRDQFIRTVYGDIYHFARAGGGSMGGGLVWQIMAEGMESSADGYEIVLPRDPSTNGVLMNQSGAMSLLARAMSRSAEQLGRLKSDDDGQVGETSHGRARGRRKEGRNHRRHANHRGGRRRHGHHHHERHGARGRGFRH